MESFNEALPQGGDFTLSMEGERFRLSTLKGKVVLLYFGYSWCPDVCPTSLGLIAAGLRQLSDESRQQVAGVFVSVDTERDTGDRLAAYTEYFHPNIRGVTGTPEEVALAAARYGVNYQIESPDAKGDYVVNHSSTTYLLNREGVLVERLPHATPPSEIAAAIERYL